MNGMNENTIKERTNRGYLTILSEFFPCQMNWT